MVNFCLEPTFRAEEAARMAEEPVRMAELVFRDPSSPPFVQ